MHRLWKKDQVLTIPNLLSLLRLALIPLILWQFCVLHDRRMAAFLVLLSGLTDVADGFIARHFHMVSDLGKILDPVADKLTQGALILCLMSEYRLMRVLIVLFALREAVQLLLGWLTLKLHDQVNSAQWYGKLTTVLLYAVMMVLILFPSIPAAVANGLICLCLALVSMSLAMYCRFYHKILWKKD